MQGTWEEVSCSINGKAGKSSGDWSAVFAGGRLSFYTKGKEAKSWSFSLDPTTSPKRILLRGAAGERLECIYRLEGDRLTTCWRNGRPGPCPTAFEGGPGLGLDVYRRVKRGK